MKVNSIDGVLDTSLIIIVSYTNVDFTPPLSMKISSIDSVWTPPVEKMNNLMFIWRMEVNP
jgi:hypothetical protein